ncbi:hypothetical protein [Agarivorans sp. B2Z047]|uniref:hypothetical protein n=3 Tax=Agarivorans sp. B2Z047 TaxID=2652721 RepID=UPI0020195768|nr:hypothetical protein [Agarivorans sp. B2Z047]UQN41876.1 hypothetical protein LQZ07_19170 [Agarivorans sp. B2Z047]
MIVDELITLLGLKSDPSVKRESEGFNKSMRGMEDSAKKLAAGIVVAQGLISAFVLSFAASADEAGKFADQNNITYESLQELEFAMERVGGSSAELRGDISKLAEEFGNLGPADKMLEDLAERMEGLSRTEQLQLGKQLGLSQGTLRLIAEGRDGIAALREEARALGIVMSEETKKDAAAFQDGLYNLKKAALGVAFAIAAGLLPELSAVTNGMTDFIVANKEIIASSVEQVVRGIAMGFGIVSDVIGFLLGLLPEFTGELDATRAIALVVAGALGVLAKAAIVAALPFVKIGLVLAALILIIEDLWALFTGGESVIGNLASKFAESFPAIAKVVEDTIAFIVGIFGKVKWGELWKALIGQAKKNLGFLKDIFTSVFQFIEDLLSGKGLAEAAKNLGSNVTKAFKTAFGDLIAYAEKFLGDLLKKIVDFDIGGKIKSFFGFGSDEDLSKAVDGVAQVAQQTNQAAPVAGVPATTITNTNNQAADNRQLNVTVNGTGDSAAVGREVVNRTGFSQTALGAEPLGGG